MDGVNNLTGDMVIPREGLSCVILSILLIAGNMSLSLKWDLVSTPQLTTVHLLLQIWVHSSADNWSVLHVSPSSKGNIEMEIQWDKLSPMMLRVVLRP